MKDVTSTSFGLLIAFLLPGFVGVYSVTFWSATVKHVFERFLTAESNVGLLLMLVLAALAAGLQVTAVRWLLYESWRSRRTRLGPNDFAALGSSEDRLAAFRAAADEHYRYHQFWGGMSIVIPFLYWGLRSTNCADLAIACNANAFWVFLVIEAVTIKAAIEAYRNYVSRARQIMSGGANA